MVAARRAGGEHFGRFGRPRSRRGPRTTEVARVGFIDRRKRHQAIMKCVARILAARLSRDWFRCRILSRINFVILQHATPADIRLLARCGEWTKPTAGLAIGVMQAISSSCRKGPSSRLDRCSSAVGLEQPSTWRTTQSRPQLRHRHVAAPAEDGSGLSGDGELAADATSPWIRSPTCSATDVVMRVR
jgi:hypothetical protein